MWSCENCNWSCLHSLPPPNVPTFQLSSSLSDSNSCGLASLYCSHPLVCHQMSIVTCMQKCAALKTQQFVCLALLKYIIYNLANELFALRTSLHYNTTQCSHQYITHPLYSPPLPPGVLSAVSSIRSLANGWWYCFVAIHIMYTVVFQHTIRDVNQHLWE